MKPVTLSSKFQIIIPEAVRERMKLSAGDRFLVIGHDDRIELIPVRSIQDMRGRFKGIGNEMEREDDRL